MADLSASLPSWYGAPAWRIVVHAAASLTALACAALADQTAALEDAVKAAFIYKFAPFVTWPLRDEGQESFHICSFGNDGVTTVLAQMTTGERVDNRPIVLQPIQTPDQLTSCRILYVAAGVSADGVLNAVKTKPVLTISQSPQRGIVQLVSIEHHVRFDIDLDLAKQSGLVISSKLLGLAHAVHPASKESG